MPMESGARNNVGDERLEAGVEEAGQVGRSVHVRRLVVHDHLAKGLQQVRGARVAANDEPVGKLEPQRQHGRVNVVVLADGLALGLGQLLAHRRLALVLRQVRKPRNLLC